MLSIKEVYKLQSDYSVADGNFKDSEITFDEYMKQCRIFLSANLPEEYSKGTWDTEKKRQVLMNLASRFVDLHKVKVRGYVTKEGILDQDLLLQDVLDAVTGASILKEALEDPEVDEIQINDKNTIFVLKRGVAQPYVDSRGRVMQFGSNDEVHIVLNKLIDDGMGNIPQFTEGNPILNAKTAQHQYRINAVHYVANTMDKPPNNFPITTVVIRKFKEVKLTIDDLIKNKAITPKMGRLLMLFGRADLDLFCVGPAGSGKTTLLNIIANTIPLEKRIILVQNPTEIFLAERDQYGRNIRNVVHWEVSSNVSMATFISNSLRATPDVIIVGESREAEEFYQILRAMRTGHQVMGTFHAEDAVDGVGRFATEITMSGSMGYSEALRLVADTIDIIIAQYRFADGKRRVMEISEVLGVNNEGKVQVNKLFEFKLSGETRKAENGMIEVLGKFEQVGTISEKLQRAFYKAGVSRSEIEEFMTISDSMD